MDSRSEVAALRSELADARRHVAALTMQLEEIRFTADADGRESRERDRDAAVRLRNTLAMMRSVFSRTVETAESVDDVVQHFTG